MKCLVGTLNGNICLYSLETSEQWVIAFNRVFPHGRSSVELFKSNFSITVEIEIDTLDYEEVISKIPVEFFL